MIFLIYINNLRQGLFIHELPNDDFKAVLYRLHIFIGCVVFIITLMRIIWKFMDHKVEVLDTTPIYFQFLAKAMHFILYAVMLGASGAGLGYIITSGLGEMLFLSNDKIWPIVGDYLAAEIHEKLTTIMIPLLGLHILAALYHQYIIKDNIFNRIWFKD